MSTFPKFNDFQIEGERVFVRVDIDIEDKDFGGENKRIKVIKNVVDKILEKNPSKIILAGHRGRPGVEEKEVLGNLKIVDKLSEILEQSIHFVENFRHFDFGNGRIFLLENLRFETGEEENSEAFARELSSLSDIYINEAFAVSHRRHASVYALPIEFKKTGKECGLGLRFLEEIEKLSRVFVKPKRPVVAIISGVKEDKLKLAEKFENIADKVLIGGRLPTYLTENERDKPIFMQSGKFLIAKLEPDREDITIHSIERFGEEISKAGTILLSGPLGKFEDEGRRQGTKRVFEAVAESSAIKIAGGGDTSEAIVLFGLEDKFDWISVGGGASLEFLANQTLPGIEALGLDL